MKKSLLIATLAAGLLPSLAQAAAEGGDNLLRIDWSLWVWTILVFVTLVGLLGKLAFKPIAEALDKRAQSIKQALAEANQSRADAKKLMEDYQQQLAAARAQANQVIEEARVLSEKVRQDVVDQATAEAAAVVQRAQEDIQRQKEKGVQELKDTVAALSVQIAGRVLEKEIDAATHRQLVDNLIKDLTQLRKA